MQIWCPCERKSNYGRTLQRCPFYTSFRLERELSKYMKDSLLLTFPAAVEFSSQRDIALPRDRVNSNEFCYSGVLEVMADYSITVSVSSKNLERKYKSSNIYCLMAS